jgi:hypothetical protein
MSESPEFILSKIVSRTNANDASYEAKNNRYHYTLEFKESVGWDWLYLQVMKLNNSLEIELEIWEIHPYNGHMQIRIPDGRVGHFSVEVREVQRREKIDTSQRGLEYFSE